MTNTPPPARPTQPPVIIEKAKRELEQMIDLVPDAMLMTDPAGMILRTNRALLTLVGAKEFAEVLGQTVDLLFKLATPAFPLPLDPAAATTTLRNSIQGALAGQPCLLQLTILRARHAPDLFVVFVEDVDRDRHSLEQIERQYKRETVHALMGTLMHNVNQPLTVILLTAQLLDMDTAQNRLSIPEFKENVARIIRETLKIGGMLQQLQNPHDFVTESYVGTVEMLDVKRSLAPLGPGNPLFEGSGPALMAKLVEHHQPGYHLHAEHVSRGAEFLARAMKLSESDCAAAARAGMLHDIGKIGIPDDILRKPGALTRQEMNIIKTHSAIGKEILATYPFMEQEAEVAWCHHEYVDGRGYPRGMKGSDLSLLTRMVSVADCYDVMRAGRSYCEPKSLDQTLCEINKGSGTQFDPDVVKALQDRSAEFDVFTET